MSPEKKLQIKKGIASHTLAENDRAEKFYLSSIQVEKKYVDNLDNYIKLGHIKSAKDEWYQGHLQTYNALKAQYKFFKKERKLQGR